MTMKSLVISLLYLLALLKAASSQSLKTFEEPCDGDCDERKGLTCSTTTKTCECMLSSNATVYDANRSHCVTKAGFPCRRIVTSASASSTENLCVPNASCQSLNLNCECDPLYFQTRNGACAPAAKYGENCSSKKQCDRSSGMECVGSKSKQYQCQCKYPRDQYFDNETQKCISYEDGNCSTAITSSFTLPCVKNAKCSKPVFELKRGESLGKAYYYNATVGKKCECLDGYKNTKERKCLPSYQTPCDDNDNNNVCNPEQNLKCFDNKICLCQSIFSQVYSGESSKCLNLVQAKCDPNKPDCVEGAECSRNGDCKCKTGFSATVDRKCLKDFGSSCSKDECNLFRGLLSCQNGTCNCMDNFMRYSTTKKTCLSGQGSPCGQFLLAMDSQKGPVKILEKGESTGNSPFENGLINFKRVTIDCDHDAGLNCNKIDGYFQCV